MGSKKRLLGEGAPYSAACVVSIFLKLKTRVLLVLQFNTNIFVHLNRVYGRYQVDLQIR